MSAESFITSDVPDRLDRLPWSNFHRLIVLALAITWILDGLEVTIVGSLSGALKLPTGLSLSDAQIGLTGKGPVNSRSAGGFRPSEFFVQGPATM